MHDRSEWTRETDTEHKIGRKTYKNLIRFTRKCVTCEQPFSIFVTEKIASGIADSNSFGLKNCEAHRRNPARAAGVEDMEQLRMANNTMRDELAGLYERDKRQFAEIQELKGRLAQYELPGAMVQVSEQAARYQPGFGVPQNKMPWE